MITFAIFCLPQYSALQGEQLSIQWAKQSGLLPEGRASQDGAGLLIITQVGSDTDKHLALLAPSRCKRRIPERMCAQRQPGSLSLRREKSWWWVEEPMLGAVESIMVEPR